MQPLVLALVAAAALGASAPAVPADAGVIEDDLLTEPERFCAMRALVPASDGTSLVGSTCNRLEGRPIGSLVVLDAQGRLDDRPQSTALAAGAERNRYLEVTQVIAAPSAGWGGGWVAGYGFSKRVRVHHGGVRVEGTDQLQRYRARGDRDRDWEANLQSTLTAIGGVQPELIDFIFQRNGDLLVLGHATGAIPGGAYLKSDPLWLLEVDRHGRVVRKAMLDAQLAATNLGYYEVLQVVPREGGGVWITGRFTVRGDGRSTPDIAAIRLDAQWAIDQPFVEALFRNTNRSSDDAVRIRLAAAGPHDTLVCMGEWRHQSSAANVFRLTGAGEVDPTFQPFTLPGNNGYWMNAPAGELAGDADGNWYLSFGGLPGAAPPPHPPGLVKLHPDGTPDVAFSQALGTGFRAVGPGAQGGLLNLIVPAAGGRLMLSGIFDHLAAAPVTSPFRLQPNGAPDPQFHPHFSTELSGHPHAPQEDRSLYVAGDGKEHIVECERKAGAGKIRFFYEPPPATGSAGASCRWTSPIATSRSALTWRACDQALGLEFAAGDFCLESETPTAIPKP